MNALEELKATLQILILKTEELEKKVKEQNEIIEYLVKHSR